MYLEDSSKVIILLDSSIKINIITKELIGDINQTIRQRFKLELVSYISHNGYFPEF